MANDIHAWRPNLPDERLENRLPDLKPRYSAGAAKAEAERCLYCYDAPCVKACPTSIDVPTFIKKIASGNVRGAAQTIFEQNVHGVSCARVCPVEVLCVGSCVYNDWHRAPIQIGKLQRFATEEALADERRTGRKLFTRKPSIGKRVALVGAGPGSLACAVYLNLEGIDTVILERGPLPGGLNTTGVAPYKLHANESLDEVEWLLSFGTDIRFGVELGKSLSGADLLRDYDAVFVGIGLGSDSKLGIPGEDGTGVEGATAWIEGMKNRATTDMKRVARAVVVGGGNTAIDVARELAQLGVPEVDMVYRRGLEHMSGYRHEMDAAMRERVRLVEHARPVSVVRDAAGNVSALRVADAKRPAGSPDSERDIPCELIVVAIGQAKLADTAKQFPGVALNAKGWIEVDRERRTGNPNVFAGGDCINGGAEVVNAVADGRDAARAMIAGWKK